MRWCETSVRKSKPSKVHQYRVAPMSKSGQLGNRSLGLTVIGLAASAPLAAATFFYASAIEPDRIDLHHEHLTLPRLSPHFDGYRIVQISDIHAGAWLPDPRLARVIEHANSQRPDLIAITGDFVTRTYRK